MKHTPLIVRILGGALLVAVAAVSLIHPMYTRGESACILASAQRGKPYILGTAGPDSYDCSGLALDAYGRFGNELVHSAQFIGYDDSYMTIEDPADLRPGDLIFFDTIRDKDRCDHVGLWLGMNRFVHASSSEEVVMISEFDEKWQGRYSWGKHILEPYALPAANEIEKAAREWVRACIARLTPAERETA